MFFDKNFRRDCTNNTASENKIDQFLQEFEINKQQQLINDLKKNPQKLIKPNPEDEAKRLEEQKNLVKPNVALEKIMKAIKLETKTSKCIEMLKTLFKGHIKELQPAHILDTVYQLIDIPLNYRKQDDLKYLIVILNIIIEEREHCILSEYGHFYKIIDTFRVNLLLFKDDSFQFQANMKKIKDHFNKFYDQTAYWKSLNFEEPPLQVEEPPKQVEEPPQQVEEPQKVQEILEDKQSLQNNSEEGEIQQPEEVSKISAIRERLMKKKQEKIQRKEDEKIQNVQLQIPQDQEQQNEVPQQIKLVKKEDVVQQEIKVSKVDYEYTLSEDLQKLLKSKLSQYYLQKKLLFKAILSMKFLLHREWSKITVHSLINEIFLEKRENFSKEEQQKIDDFMSDLQNLKASDSKKITQRNIMESSIISNASNAKFDVKKMNMGGSTNGGDGLNTWASKQNGL